MKNYVPFPDQLGSWNGELQSEHGEGNGIAMVVREPCALEKKTPAVWSPVLEREQPHETNELRMRRSAHEGQGL